MTPMQQKISDRLAQVFPGGAITVNDVSEKHRGHGGFIEGTPTHFDVAIVSDQFKGKPRLAQHRMVHAALGKDIIDNIHALALDLKSAG